MRTWPDDDGDTINHYLQRMSFRCPRTPVVYRCILLGFQRFAMRQQNETPVGQQTLKAWLNDRAAHWPARLVIHRARIVDRFLDFLAEQGSIPTNPLAQLRHTYGQRTSPPVVRALLTSDPMRALELLRPLPRLASFIGDLLRDHIHLMHSLGYQYETQAARFMQFDRFLQGRPDLAGQSPAILLRHWATAIPTLEHAWQCEELGRDLIKAWHRIDPDATMPVRDRRLHGMLQQQRRRPYIYTAEEIRLLMATAMEFPSPRAPLRPLTLRMMIILAYCAGLRLGELVHLDLGDINLKEGEIAIRDTKFFKSRTLPISNSVLVVLGEFLDARRLAGAPQQDSSALFWHEQHAGRYSRVMTEKLLVRVLRRAGLKPSSGREGPRVHDLRHGFVVNRMLAWYREGVNPQAKLPYLAAYLGHKDINSTLIYLTITQDLMNQASERFRAFGAHSLHADEGERT